MNDTRRAATAGWYFGTTSGVITPLGLLAGLAAGGGSKATLIGSVLIIALADGMSDALGMHLAQESDPANSSHHVWSATLATFISKFFVAVTFIVPLLLFEIKDAVLVSTLWGAALISGMSLLMARQQGKPSLPIIAEHIGIAAFVVIASVLIGDWIEGVFNS